MPKRSDKTDLKTQRLQAHALLDKLSPDKLTAVRTLLEVMIEPLADSLAAAGFEEEALSTETQDAIRRSRAAVDRGETIPHGDIMREFEPEG